jgi:hypothetical protein
MKKNIEREMKFLPFRLDNDRLPTTDPDDDFNFSR